MDDSICENINDPLLKAIVRYRNHPSIVEIKKFCNSKSHFSSKNVQKEEIHEEVNINKATQNTDISTKIIKENSDIFGDFVFSNFNCCINTPSYPSLLKRADITPVHKKNSKIITGQLVYCQSSPRCMKVLCLKKCQNSLKVL